MLDCATEKSFITCFSKDEVQGEGIWIWWAEISLKRQE